MATVPDIDWSGSDKYPEDTIECQCGGTWRSHGKAVKDSDGRLRLVARKPCPQCGETMRIHAMRGDPQNYTT